MPALARTDSTDVLATWNRRTTRFWRHGRAHTGGHLHIDIGYTRKCRHRRLGLIPHLSLDRARWRREFDIEGDTPAVDHEVLHEPEAYDI